MRRVRLLTVFGFSVFLMAVFFAAPMASAKEGKLLEPLSVEKRQDDRTDQKVVLSGFSSLPSRRNILNLDRDRPWSLPRKTAAVSFIDTLRVLGLRFDFVEELPDDPLTTGNGKFDLNSFEDFVATYGHEIDPSPHNRRYFETHFEALASYYFFVSGGKIVMDTAIDESLCGDTLCDRLFDVYPKEMDSVYHLPHTMAYYGSQNPYEGLTEYFIDCIAIADQDPDIVFADYDAYFLFHAGSDRQNDVLNDTPYDLFTGYIFVIDPNEAPWVDTDGPDSVRVIDALIMPETASQNNRATALNAVMAHEFGHQLGLPDLYRTDNFQTKVGDFALMDNNGFGTGVDFGFEVGRGCNCVLNDIVTFLNMAEAGCEDVGHRPWFILAVLQRLKHIAFGHGFGDVVNQGFGHDAFGTYRDGAINGEIDACAGRTKDRQPEYYAQRARSDNNAQESA